MFLLVMNHPVSLFFMKIYHKYLLLYFDLTIVFLELLAFTLQHTPQFTRNRLCSPSLGIQSHPRQHPKVNGHCVTYWWFFFYFFLCLSWHYFFWFLHPSLVLFSCLHGKYFLCALRTRAPGAPFLVLCFLSLLGRSLPLPSLWSYFKYVDD